MIGKYIDKMVTAVNPNAGLRRQHARMVLSAIDRVKASANASYEGAGNKRAIRNWRPWASRLPDEEVLPDRETLVARCRDQYKNSPVARGAINVPLLSVVGPGLMPQCRIDREALGLSDEEADAWETNVEMLFEQWSTHTDADATRRENFLSLQSLAYLSYLQSGEVFAFMPLIKRAGTVSDVRVMLVEADRVSTPDSKYDVGSLQSGIEIGTYGEPVAYWIETTAPVPFGTVERTWSRIPAFGYKSGRQNIIHLYKQERPGQRRGIPSLAPVLTCLKQLKDYSDAELTAAVVAGMFTVFVKGMGTNILDGVTDPQDASPDDETVGLGAGAVVRLDPNEDITIANPGRPSAQFEPFIQAVIKQIGMGLNIPYEVLVRSFNASYSASRAAIMEAWRYFSSERKWFVSKFCQPIYEEWLTDMITRGKISAPGFNSSIQIRRCYCGTNWQGPVPLSIDPEKEVKAAMLRINGNLSTVSEETSTLTGADWVTNFRQRSKEKKFADTLGIGHNSSGDKNEANQEQEQVNNDGE